MLITAADRLQHVRKHVLRISQAELGERMGMTDAAITMREKGTTRITADDAHFLKEAYGVNPMWLLYGTGEMREAAPDVVSEPAPEYHIPPGCDKNQLRLRFREVVQEYMAAHGIDTVRELCENWDLNETQMSNALNEKPHRDVSLKMLMNALFYGSVNLNYVVCGKGEKFLSSKKTGTWQGGR
jgi:transcriptional regulator with XRE-family HTH domain